MSYAGDRICCDADSHIMETFDWLSAHADPDIRDRLPGLKLGGAGKMAEKAIARAVEARNNAAKTAELRANIIGGAKGWAAYGAFDKDDRRRALDDLGFRRQLVFSTFAQLSSRARRMPRSNMAVPVHTIARCRHSAPTIRG